MVTISMLNQMVQKTGPPEAQPSTRKLAAEPPGCYRKCFPVNFETLHFNAKSALILKLSKQGDQQLAVAHSRVE